MDLLSYVASHVANNFTVLLVTKPEKWSFWEKFLEFKVLCEFTFENKITLKIETKLQILPK